MSPWRRVTRACAKRDWGATTHTDVTDVGRGDRLLQRFLTDTSLDHCFAGSNVLDRARGRKKGAGAGAHRLGNFHIKAPAARRAWLWRDTGELDPLGAHLAVDWMIAQGARRQGHASDLQSSHADLLHDPGDRWLPGNEDYIDLAEAWDRTWLMRSRQAVAAATHEAEQHRNELIAVDIDGVVAAVGQGSSVVVHVVEEYAERWVIIDRLDSEKHPVEHRVAFALAEAAFDRVDSDEIEELFERTEILDGRHVVEPATSFAWCAVV